MSYRMVETLTDAQMAELVELYRPEFWSQHRELADVKRMLAGTDVVIGLVDADDRLIAFTRVLTDFVYRATVYDVIVRSSHRGEGLGAQLLDAIVQHPKLRDVEVIALFCLPEMVPFYERWGFSSDAGGMALMFRGRQ